MTKFDENYVPFGPEWKAEMMKWRKADLVKELKSELQKRQHVERATQPKNRGEVLNEVDKFMKQLLDPTPPGNYHNRRDDTNF